MIELRGRKVDSVVGKKHFVKLYKTVKQSD